MWVPTFTFSLFLAIILTNSLYKSPSDYIEYQDGDFPLIISSPHGGDLKPDEFPNRRNGCETSPHHCVFEHQNSCGSQKICKIVTGKDGKTQEIARLIGDKIFELTSRKPFMVITTLHRSKLDPNRTIGEAAQGNANAEEAWNTYHHYIGLAKDKISAGGPGLLVDIHGQIHKPNRTELGYTLNNNQLNGGAARAENTSFRAVGERNRLSLDEMLSGPNSFGSLMQQSGFAAVPSPDIPYPGTDLYFSGGYITYTHGSKYGGIVDAVQLEMPDQIRMHGDEMRDALALALAQNIITFMEIYYHL